MKQKNEVFSQKQELDRYDHVGIVLVRCGTVIFIVVMAGALVNHLVLSDKDAKEIANSSTLQGSFILMAAT